MKASYLAQALILGYSSVMQRRSPVPAGPDGYTRRFVLVCLVFLMAGPLLWSQAVSFPGVQHGEPFSFIGMKLEDLFKRFGPPRAVYAARGAENWQDDVVFVYDEGELFIHRDRVWKIGLKSVFGFGLGDAKAVSLLILGEEARDEGDYVLYPLSGGVWPLVLHVSVSEGRISAIYVYRPDF